MYVTRSTNITHAVAAAFVTRRRLLRQRRRLPHVQQQSVTQFSGRQSDDRLRRRKVLEVNVANTDQHRVGGGGVGLEGRVGVQVVVIPARPR